MKFTNALKDEDMRKQAATEVDAELSIARDYALAKAAAEAHPLGKPPGWVTAPYWPGLATRPAPGSHPDKMVQRNATYGGAQGVVLSNAR
jgi:hypothetical protein